MQIKNAHLLSDLATSLSVPEENILEAFLPTGMLLGFAKTVRVSARVCGLRSNCWQK